MLGGNRLGVQIRVGYIAFCVRRQIGDTAGQHTDKHPALSGRVVRFDADTKEGGLALLLGFAPQPSGAAKSLVQNPARL